MLPTRPFPSPKLSSLNGFIQSVFQAEIELKSQEEAWKDLLICAGDPEQYRSSLNRFERLGNSTQNRLKDILARSQLVDYPTGLIRSLVVAHQKMGIQSREILNKNDRSDLLNAMEGDEKLDELNQSLAAKLANIVEASQVHVDSLKVAHKTEMEEEIRQSVIFSLASVGLSCLSCAFFLIGRSKIEKTMVKATELAENANHAKDTFLASISYHIRTPMNSIVGFSEILSDMPLTRAQAEHLSTIRESGLDLLGIIDEMLHLTKIEGGKVEIKPASFPLRECVNDASDLIAPRAVKKGLEFTVSMDPNLPVYITTDEMRMRQIMVNLLGNAVKFTEKGQVDMRVEGVYEESGGYCLRIHISDTGPGIRSADQALLFDPFRQVGNSERAKAEGTGLGLVISRDLARLMNGDITIHSIFGEGTTFTVTIRPETVSKEILKLDALDPSAIHDKSIAVVDASDFNRQEIVRFLRRWGADVYSWDQAEGLLQHLKQGSIWQLVILGSNLKDIPCDDFASQLREQFSGQIGALLKWMPHDDGLKIGERVPGFNGVIQKPIQSKHLTRTLSAILGKHTLQKETRVSPAEMKARMGLLRPMKIVVAEDILENLKVAEITLKKLGYTPRLAKSGIEVLKLVEQDFPDVIFMDMQMPIMDGLDASREIRERYGYKDRPWIVALTANAMDAHRKLCLEAGMNDFLPKPIESKSVQKIIHNVPLDISKPPTVVEAAEVSVVD